MTTNEFNQTVSYLFTDVRGLLMQVSREIAGFSENLANLPKVPLSGAMIPGWQENSESDLYLAPDPTWCGIDPTSQRKRLLVFSHPTDPYASEPYKKDVRHIAKCVENDIKKRGIADEILIGPELEFHAFKGVRYSTSITSNFVFFQEVDGWENNSAEAGQGHRMGHPSMHFATSPVDQFVPLRDDIANALRTLDIDVVHHSHESGPSQQEIGVRHKTLTKAADEVQLQKFIVKNVAVAHGLTATFMPKPMAYAAGNGMHVNISLWKNGINIFYGGEANKLSQQGEYFVAGVLRHVKALNAITNPSTNSYRRLRFLYSLMSDVKYGYRNRTTVIRIPHFESPEECRIEVRFPDSSANPYLAFSAIILAGADGIENELNPGEPVIINPKWYENQLDIRGISENSISRDLFSALQALHLDRKFLLQRDLFSNEIIDSIIADGSFFCHWSDTTPHPQEFPVHFSS